MNAFYLFLLVLTLFSAGMAVFGRNIRLQVIAVWVCSLILSFTFLSLKNELLALTLCFISTAVCWAVITHSLVFGEIQRPREVRGSWRNQILPVTGALMFLAIVLIAIPAPELQTALDPVTERVVVADFGKQMLSRFFIFAIVVASVALSAVVGVGMVARTEWLNTKEKP